VRLDNYIPVEKPVLPVPLTTVENPASGAGLIRVYYEILFIIQFILSTFPVGGNRSAQRKPTTFGLIFT
jgi:hypothetical protein